VTEGGALLPCSRKEAGRKVRKELWKGLFNSKKLGRKIQKGGGGFVEPLISLSYKIRKRK